MNRIKKFLVVGLALAGLAFVGIGCDGSNGSNPTNGSDTGKPHSIEDCEVEGVCNELS
jgi:hypothetical protein